jgi:hypothetical protein
MKNLFLTLVVALFVNTAFAFASNEEPKIVLVKTSKELTHLLNSIYIEGFLEKEELVKVLFTVNDLQQVVVLQVYSNNSEVQTYITHALNYKKLTSNELTVGKDYVFDVRFQLDGQH